MLPIHSAVLHARVALTGPWRRARVRHLAARGAAPISALFYHRVADWPQNPWTICCARFARHVEYCRKRFDLISLAELQHRCSTATSFHPAVSFTFDDGYAENCRFALPLLIQHRIPCTYFVALENILTGKPFAHDLRAGMPLGVNTVDEVRAMADAGIEIGLHTRTHLDMAGVKSHKVLRSEINDAAAELADLLGRPVRYFAFPFGLQAQLTPQAIRAVHEAGLAGFCSAYGAYNLPGQDTYHIRRIHGDREMARLKNWLTYDRAKLAKQPTIAYSLPPAQSDGDELPTAPRGGDDLPAAQREATEPQAAPHPLKVLFVITSMPVGGAETLLVNLIDRFDSSRIVAEVVCLKSPGELGMLIGQRHQVHSGLTTDKWDLRVLPRLIRLLRSRRADAVITVGAGDKMFWGRLAARLAGVPVVCSALHSTGWPDGVSRLNRLLTPITDYFIAVADQHGRHLIDQQRFPAQKVRVIRNGVDCQRFSPSPAARAELLEELSLPSDAQLVGIVAALRPEKNHEMFLQMAAALCRNNARAHFLIVGDGIERPGIQQQIRQLELQDRVHLLGTRHDTPRIVAAMDVFTLCSHNEAAPVSILEAMACGVAVVSTNVGSVSEMIRPDQTGLLVPPGDTDGMCRCVETLLGDAGLRERLGAAARLAVQQRGSLAAMVAGYTQLIESAYRRKTVKPMAEQSVGSWEEIDSTEEMVTVDLGRLPICALPLDPLR